MRCFMINKAGCILLDKESKRIALVYRDYRDDYSFPKGHVEAGESLIECAIRETEEEIKRKVRLLSNEIFCYEEYDVNNNKIRVNYYLGIDDGVSNNDSLEVHELVWCDINFVVDKLTYETSKKMFDDVKDKIINSINK